MPITWLGCILSRRYALTVTGDPIPDRSSTAAPVPMGTGADGGHAKSEAHGATNAAHGTGSEAHGSSARVQSDPSASMEPATEAADATGHTSAAIAPKDRDAGPFLILPNNPSLIDPLLLYAHVASLKPLVVLRREQSAALRMFAGSAEMVILPPEQDAAVPDSHDSTTVDVDTAERAGSTDAAEAALDAVDTNHEAAEHAVLTRVADALAQGRSVILWASPHVQHTVYECVPVHNAAFSLLQLLKARGQALPELFLVRAEGLWGSRFSWYHGHAPSFGGSLWPMLPALLLGPLLKRRPVRLVMRRHNMDTQALQQSSFQMMLNAWFDAGHKDATLVPLLALQRIRCMPLEVLTMKEACAAVHAAMQANAATTSANVLAPQPEDTATPPAPSLPVSNAAPAVGVNAPPLSPASAAVQPAPLTATPAPAAHISSGPAAHEAEQAFAQAPTDTAQAPQADTVLAPAAPNAPLADLSPAVPRTPPLLPVQHALTRQGSVTDASYGQHFSRRTLLGLAKAIGTLLGPVPATRIGMSLPCGTGALATYIAILDCTLEDDRIPVILDPSMTPDQLAQCAHETGITHVVTSRTLNGRGLPPNTSPVYLEDITSAQIMRGSALSFMGFAGTTEVDSLAAIICSPATASGTAAASGQPLTTEARSDARADVRPLLLQHQELMASLHNLMEQLNAPPLNVHSLSVLGCLPPHSPLGLLVNVVLPLTCGVPIVTVNATQNTAVLARSAENYSVNFFTGSPASMAQLLHEARSHLPFRYVMLSQEPCPPELLALIPKACPHARIFSADRYGNIALL